MNDTDLIYSVIYHFRQNISSFNKQIFSLAKKKKKLPTGMDMLQYLHSVTGYK